jgi:chromosomal replication initiation ATPase DnaA
MSYAENLTPTQRQLAAERKARLQRMNARAVPQVPCKSTVRVIPIKESGPEPEALDVKIERIVSEQVREHIVKAMAQLEAARRVGHGIRVNERSVAAASPLEPKCNIHPSIDAIKRAVCELYGVSLSDIEGRRRDTKVCRPRQIVMHLAIRLTPRSMPFIGRQLGGRDHTTILSGNRRIERLRQENATIDADILMLESKLTADLESPTPSSEGLSG